MNEDLALKTYALDCQNAATQFIEKSTRFNVSDTQFLATEASAQAMQVIVLHTIDVASEVTEHQGNVNLDVDDFATKDYRYYEQLVIEQAAAELAREDTLAELADAVANAPFGEIKYKTPIRVHPQRFFHTYTCNNCNGNGKVTCGSCSGNGNVRCYSCGGGGTQSCSSCGGSGMLHRTESVRDYNGNYHSEVRQHPCNCRGGRVTCSGCGGSGNNTCNQCNGAGLITCNNCAGYGCFTIITATTTYTTPQFDYVANNSTPSYFADIIKHIELPNLARHGQVNLINLQKNMGNANTTYPSVAFDYDASLAICDLSIKVRNHPAKLIMYGEPAQFFDTDGILEKLLSDDYVSLNQHIAGAQKFSPLFYRQAQKTLSVFMASEVHQEVLDADGAGNSADAIHVKLHRSVSVDYITEALASIKKSVKYVLWWSWLKWTLAILAAATPIIIAITLFNEREKAHTIDAAADKLILFPWLPNASIPFDIALFTIPITLLGGLLMLWQNKKWLKQTGGNYLLNWANSNSLLAGKWLAISTCLLVTFGASAFFKQFPVWIDKQGALYGKIGFFNAPEIAQTPIMPAPEIAVKKTKNKTKKQKKQNKS